MPTRLQMPVLLFCGWALSAFFAGFGGLVLVIFLGAFAFLPRQIIEGQQISRVALLAQESPVWILYPLLVLWFGAIAYAFYRERAWSRMAIVALWLAYGLLAAGSQAIAPQPMVDFASLMVGWGAAFALALLYLFGAPGVRRYYDAIAARQLAPAAMRSEQPGR